jgi:small subunit ribosomal protein S17
MAAEAETNTDVAKGQPTPKTHPERGARRKLTGRVINDTSAPGRAKKTVVVEVVRRFRDPFYGKYVKRRRRFHAHDENHEYKTRDLVEIMESRPLSKTKRWVVTRLLDRPPEV